MGATTISESINSCNISVKYAFFIDGGTLAVENALKAAFDWKRRVNIEKNIKTKGNKVIFFKDNFF